MKNVKTAAAAVLFSLFGIGAFAQTQEPTTPATEQPATEQPATQEPMEQPATQEPVVATADMNDSVKTDSNLLPMPEPLTVEKIFPVIGQYQASGEQTQGPSSITVTLDPENKGIAWINGLEQGKVKALLLRSPATYKIPAQKTEEGNDVKEGTLIYDKETQIISMCLGCKYNAEDPEAAFRADEDMASTDADATATAKPKAKSSKKDEPKEKHWVFVGTKVVENTTSTF